MTILTEADYRIPNNGSKNEKENKEQWEVLILLKIREKKPLHSNVCSGWGWEGRKTRGRKTRAHTKKNVIICTSKIMRYG